MATDKHTHVWDDRDGFCVNAACSAHISDHAVRHLTGVGLPPVDPPTTPQPVNDALRRQVLLWVAEAVGDLPWTPEGLAFVLRKAASGKTHEVDPRPIHDLDEDI